MKNYQEKKIILYVDRWVPYIYGAPNRDQFIDSCDIDSSEREKEEINSIDDGSLIERIKIALKSGRKYSDYSDDVRGESVPVRVLLEKKNKYWSVSYTDREVEEDEEVCISLHEPGEEETEPLFIDGVDLSITIWVDNRKTIQFYQLPF